MDDDEFVGRYDPEFVQSLRNPHIRLRVASHFNRVTCRIRRLRSPAVDNFEQIPLVPHRMSRTKGPRTGYRFGIHPRPPGDCVADALRRSRKPRQPRASRTTVQIQHEIIPFTTQAPRQLEIRHDSRDSRCPRGHDHIIEMRISDHDWRGWRLHQIREMRVRKRPLQCPEHRRREDDITDEAEANQ